MKILERYILQENFKPFIGSLAVITFIMLINKILEVLNMVIEKDLSLLVTVNLFLLSLPFIVALSVPMATLMGSIMSFGRLAVDNELTAFKSCGINIYRLMRPTIIMALLLSIFMVWFNDEVLPDANYKLTRLYAQIRMKKPESEIVVHDFTTVENYSIYVDGRENGELTGIIIFARDKNRPLSTITAKRGRINIAPGGTGFNAVLENGSIFERSENNSAQYDLRYFSRLTLNLPQLTEQLTQLQEQKRGDREMTVSMMKAELDSNLVQMDRIGQQQTLLQSQFDDLKKLGNPPPEARSRLSSLHAKIIQLKQEADGFIKDNRRLKVEIHKKFALAFACFIMVLVGIPVGTMTRTSGVGMAFTVSSVVYLLYYMALVAGEELADKGYLGPFLAMWGANIIMLIAGVYLIYMTAREAPPLDLSKLLKKLGRWLWRHIKRKKRVETA